VSTEAEDTARLLRIDRQRVRWFRTAVAVLVISAVTYGWQLYEARNLAMSNRTLITNLAKAITPTPAEKAQNRRVNAAIAGLFEALNQHRSTIEFEHTILQQERILLAYQVALCLHVPGCHQIGLR
jgi:hypothetical protein